MVQEKGKNFSGSRSALAMIMFCLITRSELDIDGSRKRKKFFRLALRARHDYVLPNHTFEENLTVQEKGFFFFFGSRYALTMIILCLINPLSELVR